MKARRDDGSLEVAFGGPVNGPARAPGKGSRTADLPNVQRRASGEVADVDATSAASAGLEGASESLPFCSQIQALYGHHDVGHVRARVGGPAKEASESIGARAYAMGDEVAFAEQPDLHTAAHESAHVVQQRSGVQRKALDGGASDPYEVHADRVADLVVSGRSAESALDELAGSGGATVRRKEVDGDAAALAQGPVPIAKATTLKPLVVRTGPGTSHARVSVKPDWVDAGATFDVIAVVGSWLNVTYQGAPAYISGDPAFTATVQLPPAAAPATAPPAEESGGTFDAITGAIGEAADAVGDAVTGAVDAVTGAIGAGVDLVAGFFTSPSPAPAKERAELEEEAKEPEAKEPGKAGPEFLSQLDNEWDKDGVEGANMCTVTSLAMQLIALFGGADAVQKETNALIAEFGGTAKPEHEQTEDVLMLLFDTLKLKDYWTQFISSTEEPFYKDWSCDRKSVRDVVAAGKWHQLGACQAKVLSMFAGVSSDNQSTFNRTREDGTSYANLEEFHLEHIRPQIESGVTFAESTKLTGGHFVTLVQVLDDGLVIHDPYGARGAKTHLLNGQAPETMKSDVTFTQRFREHAALKSALDTDSAMPNWGESNFFSWSEVEKWQIGKSVTSASNG